MSRTESRGRKQNASKNKGKVQQKGIVTFLHPDLGIGGAERLIVDAAVGLQEKGYEVSVITGYHDPNRAFPETTDGTLKVIRVGSFIPRSICGRLVALFAYFKMIYAALYLNIFSRINPQVVICDQVSACIPFLKLNPFIRSPRIMFYCHYPDQLLTKRETFLKKLYRMPIDFFEEISTGLADKIVVNSQFTRKVFSETFKRISLVPDVLYPSINSKLFDQILSKKLTLDIELPSCQYLFVSINRFERKKDIALAIRSLTKLRSCLDENEWSNVHLLLAGGYDVRLQASIDYLAELKNITKTLKLEDHVTFLLSPSDSVKIALLVRSTALVYTPSNEHFGIVPLEAMYLGKPVIAVDSGGPRETVVDGVTGFLCPPIDSHVAVSMARLIKDPKLKNLMGKSGKERFLENFSFNAFSLTWDRTVGDLSRNSIGHNKDEGRFFTMRDHQD